MRDYGKISTTIWRSRKFRSLPDDESKLFYFYLHTCPHVNSVGCYVLPIGYIEADLGWPQEAIRQALDSLCTASLVAFDRLESVVRIVDYLRHDPFTNESHAKGAIKIALQLPDCLEKLNLLKELADLKRVDPATLHPHIEKLQAACREPVESLSTGCRPEPEPEPEPESISLTADAASVRDEHENEFEQWWQLVPRKVGKGQARKAYRAARKKADAETLLAGIGDYAQSVAGKDPQYVCHPATWLNGERWLDDAPTANAAAKPNGSGSTRPPEFRGWPDSYQRAYMALENYEYPDRAWLIIEEHGPREEFIKRCPATVLEAFERAKQGEAA